MTHPLIRDNLTLLDQTRTLAQQIDPVRYLEVGSHFRHLTDHYLLFLAHLPLGTIDYDLRDRNTGSEKCCNTLLLGIEQVIEGLKQLDVNPISSIRVRCATCTKWEAKGELSTIGRELMFLHSHATHHLALISVRLEMSGVDVDPVIGMAPSTQRHYSSGIEAAG